MKKVVIIIGIILAICFSLNSINKSGVDTIGSKAIGAEVKLNDVNISLLSGKGQLKGLFVGNPEGFKSDRAFMLNEVRLAINVKSVFSDRIIVEEVYIDAPDITYEKGSGGDNIKAIMKNIESFAGGDEQAAKKEEGKKSEESGKKIQINSLVVKDGKINMSATVLQGEKLALSLPDIHMKDIGKEKEGTTISKALQQVFAMVNKNIITAVAGSVVDIGKGAEEAVSGTIGKSVGGAVDKLKGLFGK
jgi:hypothetical protein